MYKLPITTLLFLGVITCSAQDAKRRQEGGIPGHEYSISIVRLIATPEKYHNKQIQVEGYLNLEFEGDAIYLHEEDYKKGLTRNGFWVSFSNKLDKKAIPKLNKGYVLIEGTFDMNSRGHMGLFGGEIRNITRITKWE
jgi:hypothetical protein